MSLERPSKTRQARQAETIKEVEEVEIAQPEIQPELEPENEASVEVSELEPSVEDLEETSEIVTPSAEQTAMQTELKGVLKLPRAERKEALAQFKKKLFEQQEAQAFYRTKIESVLEQNPDMPKEDVMELLEDKERPIPDEYKEKASHMLDAYYVQRTKVLEARTNFPDDRELVKHLTSYDLSLKSKVEVKVGPLSIDIFVDQKDINEIGEWKGYGRNPIDGFAAIGPNGVQYSLINADAEEKEQTLIHERQHHVNKILGGFFEENNKGVNSQEVLNEYDATEDLEEKKEFLTAYFEIKRGAAYGRAKDEIFAVLRGGQKLWWIKNLLKPGTEGSNYDYLKDVRERRSDDPLWNEISDNELVKEYYRVIDNSIETLESLTDYYSAEELIAILTPIPLEDWSKMAARLYQEKLLNPDIKATDVRNMKKYEKKEPKVSTSGMPVDGGGNLKVKADKHGDKKDDGPFSTVTGLASDMVVSLADQFMGFCAGLAPKGWKGTSGKSTPKH